MPTRFATKALTACCAVFLLQACDSGDDPAEKQLTPVRVQTAERQDVSTTLSYSASVEAQKQVDLAFKVDGYITSLLQEKDPNGQPRDLQPGDRVAKDSVLATVEKSDYQNTLKQANAGLASAEAQYNQAELDYKRSKALFDSQSITAPQFDNAKQKYESAGANVKTQKAQLAEAENTLGHTELTAPFDGVVIQRNVEVGSLVAAGTVGFVVADTAQMNAVFGVPEAVAGGLNIGQAQDFSVESLANQTFKGTITEIAPAADSTSRVFDVSVKTDNSQGALKIGMIAKLNITQGGGDKAVLLVPLSAVVAATDGSKGYAVFVLEQNSAGGSVRLKTVELGQVYGDRIAVWSGLDAESLIVVSGAKIIADGESVKIVP